MSNPKTTARTATRAGRTTRSNTPSTAISTMSAALAGQSAPRRLPSLVSSLASPERWSTIRSRLVVGRSRTAAHLVAHADRPGAGVGADHGAERHDLDRVRHVDAGQQL